MKKVRISKQYTCDELNKKLKLSTKIKAILYRGEDIEFVFEEDDNEKINMSITKLLSIFSGYREKKRSELKDLMEIEEV